jgi:hypothetical protein
LLAKQEGQRMIPGPHPANFPHTAPEPAVPFQTSPGHPSVLLLPSYPHPHRQALVPQQQPVSQQPLVQPQVETFFIPTSLRDLPALQSTLSTVTRRITRCQPIG